MTSIKRESVTTPPLGFGTPSKGNCSDDEVPLDATGIEALAKRREFEERREEEDKVEGSNKRKEPEVPRIPRFGIGRGRGGEPPGGPSRNPSPGNPAQGSPMPRELKINFPKTFNGKPLNLKRFLQDTQLYLQVNNQIYDSDDKKTMFMLSLLTDGPAATWKDNFLRACEVAGEYLFPRYSVFISRLKESFWNIDEKVDALQRLTNIMQKNNSIEAHNVNFMLLLQKAEIDATASQDIVVDYYCKSLNKDILAKLWERTPTPTTLTEHMNVALDIDLK